MSGIYWLASYPKSGNTWMRAFLANLQQDGERPVSINDIGVGDIASRRSTLDAVLGFDTADLTLEEIERLRPDVYDWCDGETGVRYCKIHDAYTRGPDGRPLVGTGSTRGAVYIVRNPLDVVSSAAQHWNLGRDATIARMADPDAALARHAAARGGLQVFQRMLSWSGHVLSWVDAPGLACLPVRYEDMLAQPLETFTRVAGFLGMPADAGRVAKAVRFSSFEVLAGQEAESGFRERPAHAERFFREGRSGGWRDRLDPGQVARILADHGAVMRRFGYLDEAGEPV
ncbi:Sulfotransferase domain protein [Pigmentiphaga humi]|uniref:Sulfotransferase domain protein n=1 Tax=Pigmentiphaga humi TaxID=2478468 RepID=A0A3P4B1X0_9BURK|nr:sulfotransferase domain-containing protein [Pigmentiphaga humi]VCU70052.1 Sulfotransferase domain protein [Pigmentiphaga humi]